MFLYIYDMKFRSQTFHAINIYSVQLGTFITYTNILLNVRNIKNIIIFICKIQILFPKNPSVS